jgi:hypothetical protein
VFADALEGDRDDASLPASCGFDPADHRFLAEVAALPLPAFDWTTWCKQTLVRVQKTKLRMPEAGMYDLTHALLYATAFGDRAIGLSNPESAEVAHTVQRMLVRSVHRESWDIVGELLICLDLLAASGSTVYEAADRAFHCAVRSDGAVVAHGRLPAYSVSGDETRGRQCDLSCFYHTTLVSLLHCAVRLQQ